MSDPVSSSASIYGTAPANGHAPETRSGRGLSHWMRVFLRGRGDHGLRDTIEELIEEHTDEDTADQPLDDQEKHLISNILALRSTTVDDCMVPRSDIVGVEISTPLPDFFKLFAQHPHSRFPVYRETLDDVIGSVHIKDILNQIASNQSFDLTPLIREALVVAPSMEILDLLPEMRIKRVHMALVVDEFGGIDGLVTIEDLVEQIVGEISGEHDKRDIPEMEARPDGTIVADGRVSLDEFAARYGEVFSEDEREENDTLGGLVSSLAGQLPGRGGVIRHSSGMEFEVADTDGRRIRRLRIRAVPERISA